MTNIFSCSFFVQTQHRGRRATFRPLEHTDMKCSLDSHISGKQEKLISHYPKLSKVYARFISLPNATHQWDETSKFALWVLIHLSHRPYRFSPSSAIELLSAVKNETVNYLYSTTTDSIHSTEVHQQIQHVYLSLERILKKNSNWNLRELLSFIDKNQNTKITLDRPYIDFITKNQSMIRKSKILKKYYLYNNEIPRPGDQIKTASLLPSFSTHLKRNNFSDKNKSTNENYLPFSYKNYQCNIDLNLYEHSIYSITDDRLESLPIAMITPKGKIFMAYISQQINWALLANSEHSQKKNVFLPITRPSHNPAVCLKKIESIQKKSSTILALLSLKGRDPGQHLHQILNEFTNSESNQRPRDDLENMDLNFVMNYPRYLFLLRPQRILFESQRARESQQTHLIGNYRYGERPLYHVTGLGELSIISQDDKSLNYYFDERGGIDQCF